ncbi:MAG: YceI family protein [Planctomycetota bacterium]
MERLTGLRRGLLAVVLAVLAGPVAGADSARPVNLTASRVYIYVGKTGLGHNHGVEGRLKSGSLQLEGADAGGELVFDMTSFDADTDAARRYVGLAGSTDASTKQQVNANMKGAAVLDVQRYPTAKFVVDSVKRTEKKSREGHPVYELGGKFTLHGQTRPLKLEAGVEERAEGLRLRGNFRILQTQYGIRPYSKAFGAVGVADQLTIYGDIQLENAGREGEAPAEPSATVTR